MKQYKRGSLVYDKLHDSYRAFIMISGKRYSKRFKNKDDAMDWMARQKIAERDGNFIEPSDMLVGQWLLYFLSTYKKDTVRASTYERYLYLAAKIEPISRIPLQSCSVSQVQELLNSLTPDCSRKVHVLLHAAFQQAVDLNIIQKNIVRLSKAKKIVRDEPGIFNKNEINKILSYTKDKIPAFYPIFLLAAHTGMRRGEVLGLRWKDVNLKNGTVTIRQQLQRVGSEITFHPPKTKSGKRKISIPATVTAALQELRNNEKTIDIKQETLVFRNSNSNPVRPEVLERAWKKVITQCGLPYRNFHCLRHTHATLLLSAGIPIIEVSRRLGHARVSHTLDLYGHAIPSYDERIIEKINQIYG